VQRPHPLQVNQPAKNEDPGRSYRNTEPVRTVYQESADQINLKTRVGKLENAVATTTNQIHQHNEQLRANTTLLG
jgi:hypothetical protein